MARAYNFAVFTAHAAYCLCVTHGLDASHAMPGPNRVKTLRDWTVMTLMQPPRLSCIISVDGAAPAPLRRTTQVSLEALNSSKSRSPPLQ